jgi:hypothetical protein
MLLLLQTNNDKALLSIPKAVRGDTGKYNLKLKNDSGVADVDIKVIVLGQLTSFISISV